MIMVKAIRGSLTLTTVFVLMLAFCVSSFGQTEFVRVMPADFTSDGCSLFPDGNYRDCCVEHDKLYYFGGTKQERKAADRQLCDCVRAKGHRFLSPLMYLGVRVGGVAWLPTPFRWGFGNKSGAKKPEKK